MCCHGLFWPSSSLPGLSQLRAKNLKESMLSLLVAKVAMRVVAWYLQTPFKTAVYLFR